MNISQIHSSSTLEQGIELAKTSIFSSGVPSTRASESGAAVRRGTAGTSQYNEQHRTRARYGALRRIAASRPKPCAGPRSTATRCRWPLPRLGSIEASPPSWIATDLLDRAYGTDAAKLGESGTVAGMPPDIREASAAQVKAVQDKVRTQGRYEMGSESGEVYHASKHYKELPPDLQTGDPVNNTAEAARATVKDGTITKTWSEDGVP